MLVLVSAALLVAVTTSGAWAQTVWSFGIVDATPRYQINGDRALVVNAATDNVLVGIAGVSNTGSRATMVGNNSGNSNTANNGSFFGFQAGRDNTSGVDNTFIGSWAGQQNTTGGEGVFLGTWAGQANTSGFGNTYLGYMAGRVNVTGGQNTYVGWGVRSGITTGSFNTFVGYQSGGEVGVSGDHNVGIGNGAGQFNGDWNTAIGQNAGSGGFAVSHSISIGAGASPTLSNQLVMGGDTSGNGRITSAYIGQGVTNATPAAVTLNTTGGAGTNIAGASFTLAAGVSTGSATPSSIMFLTSTVGGSGTTPQSNVERWRIDGSASGTLTGANGAGLVVPSLKSNSGTRFICVDTVGAFVSQTTPCSGT